MSWSKSFSRPVPKNEVEITIDSLEFPDAANQGPAYDQFTLAKYAAKTLCAGIPGPFIQVSMSGHANGVGWQKKEGWSNDCITISVVQVTDPPTS